MVTLSLSRTSWLNYISYDKRQFFCEVNGHGSLSQYVISLGNPDHLGESSVFDSKVL